MKYTHIIIVLGAVACGLYSCTTKSPSVTIGNEIQSMYHSLESAQYDSYEDSILEPFISCNSIPEIDDLEYYFSDVPTSVLLPHPCTVHAEPIDSVDRPIFIDKIRRLQLYKDGQTTTFPLDIVEYARLNEQKIHCDMAHRGDELSFAYAFLFQYRLMQQIVSLCPDITLLTNCVSNDKKVAYDDMCDMAETNFYNTSAAYVYLQLTDGRYATDKITSHPYYVDMIAIVVNNDTCTQYSLTGLREMCTPIYNKQTQQWVNH